jgi:acetylornithine deacetylase/succinyl-diaminopimelate desuccinylase-like protein
VLKGDRLYGRGGADDGYAIFGTLSALLALHDQGIPHARCVVMIEACEESGSYDLPYYVDHLAPRIGQPSLVVCLDSGCANYDQLWLTTSLRGMTGGELTVDVLTEGVHSGDASGVVPDSFRIIRQLLSRLEDPATGTIVPKELYVDVPAERAEQAKQCAAILGDEVFDKFPWIDGMRPVSDDRVELILNRTWRPQLAVTGAAGLPALESAGNVLRPSTSLKLSLRVPPTANGAKAGEFVKQLLESDPPNGAKVTFKLEKDGGGWNAPKLSDWLDGAVTRASTDAFGAPAAFMGEGGSIPFMGMLGEEIFNKFPWVDGMQPVTDDLAELVLNRTWRPQLAVTGIGGIPPLESAGNVLRPKTAVKLSLRVPPTLSGAKAGEFVKQLLEKDPPYGAKVSFDLEKDGSGWNAPALSPWLEQAVDEASQHYFGAPATYMGEGGSIPFMGMLGEKFPQAQFLITGVLGPHSNAHGPNEFLHIPTGKKVSMVVAEVVARHAQQGAAG